MDQGERNFTHSETLLLLTCGKGIGMFIFNRFLNQTFYDFISVKEAKERASSATMTSQVVIMAPNLG